jgi:hypothetical protein
LIRKPTLMRGHAHRNLFAFVAGTISIVCLLGVSQALAAKPRLSVTFGVAGHQVNVAGSLSQGTVRNAPPPKRWRAVLEEQVGGKWLSRASGKLHLAKTRSFALSWVAPSSQAGARVRVRVRARKQTVQESKAHQIVFFSAGNTRRTDNVPGTATPLETPPPQVKVTAISPDQVLSLPSGGDNALIFAGTPSLSPGDFLTAPPGPNTPSGFLLKVLGSTVIGGQTQVQTEPASLFEAVPDGSIEADLGDLASATPLNADARTFSRALRAAAVNGDTNVPIDQHVSCGASAEMNLSGSLDASLAPHLDLQWHKKFGIPTGIDHASATVDANLSADAQAGVSAAASCELEEVTLLDPKWTVVIEVGPVPVPVTIDVPIKASASASASGSIQVSADASMQGSLGIQYDEGDVSGVKSLTKNASVTHSVEAQAELQARIGPGIGIEAGWDVPVLGELAATAGVDISSGLKLTYEPGESPPGKLCVPLTATGQMSLVIPGASDLDAGPVTLYDENIWCEWIGAIPLHWQGTVAWENHVSRPGPDHESYLNYFDIFQADETENWSVDGHTPAGVGSPGYGGPGIHFDLGYTGSWNWTVHKVKFGGCNDHVSTSDETLTANGSGSTSDDGQGAAPLRSRLTLHVDGEGEEVGTFFYLGGPDGTESSTGAGGCGAPPYTGVPVGPPPDLLMHPDGEPRVACHVDGSPLHGTDTCQTPNEDGSFSTVTWDLKVTCPNGKAPDPDWLCPVKADP